MEWVPIVFFAFKILVFGTGMFFAIKWHYDKAKKEKEKKLQGSGQQTPTNTTLGA